MARSINQIQTQIIQALQASGFDLSDSTTAVWRLWTYIFAVGAWSLENLWDMFMLESEQRIAETRVHNEKWYREIALGYQHGFDLQENLTYDNDGVDAEAIAASKIIANAAVMRLVQNGYGIVRIKVVKLVGDEYAPLTAEELTGFRAYMNKMGDAGTTVLVTSGNADLLKVKVDIHYDATIMSATGAMLDGSDAQPIKKAIEAHIKSQQYNGLFIRRRLENHLEGVRGVIVPNIVKMWTKYGSYTYESTEVQNVGLMDEMRQPDSGYLKLDQLEVNMIPFE